MDEDVMDEIETRANAGVVMEMLPDDTDPKVALGVSTAVNALADGEDEIALACLKTTVRVMEDE